MSSDRPASRAAPGEGDDGSSDERLDRQALLARVETLEAETDRLRDAVAAAQRRRYRQTALGLLAVGLVALVGAVAFPGVRTVLLALGGTGVFGAILTYVLTPERFVAASVGERIFGTLADNEAAIVDDLDLRGDPLVVPGDGDAAPARLYVPLLAADDGGVPDSEALATPFVTGDRQGLSLQPTGVRLYEALEDATGTLPTEPGALTATVGDALVEQFELVDGVDADADADGGRATLAISGIAYGSPHQFDHPVPSVLATTLAVELDETVGYDIRPGGDRGDWLVTCRW